MRYADWGVRCPRWAGIRSEEVDVCGTTVHYLRADTSASGPTHLLLHPMAGSASMWLDLVAPLSRLGPVIVPDLPGTVFGHTEAPHPRAAKSELNARFLRAFTTRLRIREPVVHGWSAGGLAAVLFAASAAETVGRLVLVTPALPGPVPPGEARFWRTAGRALLAAGPPVARMALRVAGRRLLDMKLRAYTEQRGTGALGIDPSRLSPEMTALMAEELRAAEPRRLGHAVTALTSVLSGLYVDRAGVHTAMGQVRAPVLLLAGGQDGLITTSMTDDMAARHPGWRVRVFDQAGHLLPLEMPDAYVAEVEAFLR